MIPRRTLVAAALAGLAGCQTTPTAPTLHTVPLALGPDRTGYMLFNAPITPQTARFFTNDISKLLDLNAGEIHIFMNSLGGVVIAAESMIAFMDRMHADRGVVFVTHNVGVVASAACYVFLAGQRRYSTARGQFLFHEAGLLANGTLTSQNIQDAAEQLKRHERLFLAELKARTRLTDGEALSFVRRTVILNASEARRDGIVEGIAGIVVPTGTPVATITVRPNPQARPQPAPPTIPG